MNNKVIKLITVAVVVIVAAIAMFLFVGDNADKYAVGVNLYFFDANKTKVVEELVQITYDETEDIIPKIVKTAGKGQLPTDKKRIVPKDVRVKDIIIEDNGHAVIDVNKKLLSGDKTQDVLAAYAVIKSVCCAAPVTGITHVKLTVNGEEITTSDEKALDYLSYEDIKLSDSDEQKEHQVLLYFLNTDKNTLSAEIRKIEDFGGKPLEQNIVEALLLGPKSDKLKACVFGELISVETKDRVCFVNFAFSFVEKNSGANAQAAVYSVVNSLTTLDGVDGVQFLVDGKKVEKLGDVDISTVLKRTEE